MAPESSTGWRGWSLPCSETTASPLPRRWSTRSGPTYLGSPAMPKSPTTSLYWCCAGMGLADADLDAAIPRLGDPVGGPYERLAPAPARGENAIGRNPHADQQRFHALGALQGERVVGRVRP